MSLPLHHQRDANLFDLNQVLEKISHLIPSQGPIHEFVHHNTLHAFQDKPFHEALREAAHTFGAQTYLKLGEYKNLQDRGLISIEAKRFVAEVLGQKEAKEGSVVTFTPPTPLHDALEKSLKIDLKAKCSAVMVRLISQYLDQGIGNWAFPGADKLSFFEAVFELLNQSYLPMQPFTKSSKELFKRGPHFALESILSQSGLDDGECETYLKEVAQLLPGWAGLAHQVMIEPNHLGKKRCVSLKEWFAVFMIVEAAVLGGRGVKKFKTAACLDAQINIKGKNDPRVWYQEVFEWTTYLDLLSGVRSQALKRQTLAEKRFQAIFCIDDRCCSLRRHLEEVEKKCETFGAAGFFGIDSFIEGSDGIGRRKYCPVPVKPSHVFRPAKNHGPDSGISHLENWWSYFHSDGQSLLHSWLTVQLVGIFSLIRMVLLSFLPTYAEKRRLGQKGQAFDLQVFRDGDAKTMDGLWIGYSRQEAADRVSGLLRTIGLIHDFSDLIFVIAHGASSTNNPYFAAYDCGACSGKPGVHNARAFCTFANDPEVRALVEANGITIPSTTRFIPALFDTTAEHIDFFDTAHMSSNLKEEFEWAKVIFEHALNCNAIERTRRFELAPTRSDFSLARGHLLNRSVALYEPRPEYNHATNVACVVGRRSLTRGLFLDRRAFLQSYDASLDQDGKILQGIFGAVVPVCGGINLEYFFSRVDGQRFGAGSKLPHNVVSLLGVMTGIESDLRTGLPLQMTEIHDPLRLLLIVEQSVDITQKALMANSAIAEWIINGWIWLVAIDPLTSVISLFKSGTFTPIDPSYLHEVEVAKTSLDIVRQRHNNIGVQHIGD